MQNDLKRKAKKGRYDHLKTQTKKPVNRTKLIQKVFMAILLLMAAVGILVRVIMELK